MFTRRHSLLIMLALQPLIAAEGDIKLLRFSKSFIESHYAADSAIGDLVITGAGAHPAKNVHQRSCSGDDGELHVGILNASLAGPGAPASFPEVAGDDSWGVVAELPNAATGGGPAKLNAALAEQITFHGYFRVWNEGHEHGEAAPSNPRHVFEIHHAWKFTAAGADFDKPSLVKSIPSYSGYGITKLRAMFTSLNNEEWLKVHGSGDDVFVSLRETSNFFQFPAIIRSVTPTSTGQEGTMDIFTNTDFKKTLQPDVRFVIATGSALDGTLTVGKKISLLGLFSVNLSRVLSAAASAHTEATATSVPDSLEFFVFGKPLNAAVKNSQCAAEGRR